MIAKLNHRRAIDPFRINFRVTVALMCHSFLRVEITLISAKLLT